MNHDPSLDLYFERVVPVSKELVWKAWTTPELLVQWFTPKPWQTVECEIDLRPGGIFRTVMRGPAGEEFAGASCYLETFENEKLCWTSALEPGYRPKPRSATAEPGAFTFTAVISLRSVPEGTLYSALVIHADEEAKKTHEAMGFYDGWGTALTQLVELMSAE